MTENELIEAHIEHKIRRYQQQLNGISYHMQMQKYILEKIRKNNTITPPNTRRKIEQLTFFGT